MYQTGIRHDDHMSVKQMQFLRFDGKQWERFGEILTANDLY
jgi:branched-chain amino acid transport system substrate-binding protein